ncbi:hypothetical protein D3C79_792300 [compost metagenome]
MAQVMQHFCNDQAHRAYILDHDDPLCGAAARARCRRLGLERGRGRLRVVPRQVQQHLCAVPKRRCDFQLPAGLPHKSVGHRQAQACAAAKWLCGEERVHRAAERVIRHAATRVFDTQAQIVARRQFQLAGVFKRGRHIAQRDTDPAAIGHGIAGIDAQVEQGTLKLRRVDTYRPEGVFALVVDCDVGAGAAADQVQHAADQLGDIRRARLQGLLPGERQ